MKKRETKNLIKITSYKVLAEEFNKNIKFFDILQQKIKFVYTFLKNYDKIKKNKEKREK